MSLVKTLAKVAIGVAVAKGVTGMMNKQKAGGGAGSGTQYGGPNAGGKQGGTSGGSLQDMLGSVLSGKGSGTGGLGGLLDGLSRASRPGTTAQAGTSQAGTSRAGTARSSGGSLGDLLNQSFDRFGEPDTPPEPEHEEQAALMLRAMIQAAKSDGKIDAGEKEKLMGNLGDATPDELAFVQDELAKPIDVDGLAHDTPDGMEGQVYLMSVMAIDLDNRHEAQYLHSLAQALQLDRDTVNDIHRQAGVAPLYT